MGVSFHTCNCCGRTFGDAGDHVECYGCGTFWCSNDCAESDGYDSEDDSCEYCREENYADDILLRFALDKLSLNRDQLIKEYKLKNE